MTSPNKHHVYAQSLLTDIQAASDVFLPRRGDLATWLGDFLRRSSAAGFQAEAGEVEDLTAINDYVQVNMIATTPRAALG